MEVGQDPDLDLDQGQDQGQNLEADRDQGQPVDQGDLEVDPPSALKVDLDLVQQVDPGQEVGHDLGLHNPGEDHPSQAVDLQDQVVGHQGQVVGHQGQVMGHQGQLVDLQDHVVDQGQDHPLQLGQGQVQMLALGMRVIKSVKDTLLATDLKSLKRTP